MGTVPYMSPERLRGLAADARCDVFSLGIVLYELLAGVHPFRRATAIDTVTAILNDEPAGLDTPRDALEAELASIALAMMAKEPEGRYPDAGPAHVALQALGESMLATKPFVPLGRRRSGQKLAVLLPKLQPRGAIRSRPLPIASLSSRSTIAPTIVSCRRLPNSSLRR